MTGLGRVNLLVGTNNSGKTSVLEAINILSAQGRLEIVWDTLTRRGERGVSDGTRNRVEMDVRHLFFGHELDQEVVLEISGNNDTITTIFTAKTIEGNSILTDSPQPPVLFDDLDLETSMALEFQWKGNSDSQFAFPITSDGVILISNDLVKKIANEILRNMRKRDENIIPMRFITTNALSINQIIADFDKIVITPEEDFVIQSLKAIEPNLERIAPISSEQKNSLAERGGMVVKLANNDQRIPIGSMGDGIWRMLGIALSLVNARGGILLIDEIDTGLHYKAMEDMWRLVMETATRLDVQVFATTHSRDCYQALAAISRPDVSVGSDISIQRIEKGKETAITFSERDIVIAARREIEVR
jgi:ABC-type branched-subunit amino acid transport system ATPase component